MGGYHGSWKSWGIFKGNDSKFGDLHLTQNFHCDEDQGNLEGMAGITALDQWLGIFHSNEVCSLWECEGNP